MTMINRYTITPADLATLRRRDPVRARDQDGQPAVLYPQKWVGKRETNLPAIGLDWGDLAKLERGEVLHSVPPRSTLRVRVEQPKAKKVSRARGSR